MALLIRLCAGLWDRCRTRCCRRRFDPVVPSYPLADDALHHHPLIQRRRKHRENHMVDPMDSAASVQVHHSLSLWDRLRSLGDTLENDNMKRALREVRDRLVERNVAVDVSASICRQIEQQMPTRDACWRSAESTVRNVAQAVLDAQLQTLDLFETIRQRRAGTASLFTLAVVGSNGRGKTTLVAKMAHLLVKQHGLQVGLVPADTYRAGALEQLHTHGRTLDVPVFPSAYGRDAAAVVYSAQASARQQQLDVLLVDTAGFMPHNASLMASLAKVVRVAAPDLTVLVVEALAGNDVVDQVRAFEQAVGIDAVVLTKVDTVGNKIGAVISVLHHCRKPLLFLSCGQQYADLKVARSDELLRLLWE